MFICLGLTDGWRDIVPEDLVKRVDEMIQRELGDTDLKF